MGDKTPIDLFVLLVTVMVPLILAIAIHEWAHIAMARFLGDDTGTRMGRYTLNPLAHMDPVWTLMVPVVLLVSAFTSGSSFIPFFAAGKPAPYNPIRLDREFRGKRIRLRTAELLVASAGPASNVVLAVATMLVIMALVGFGVPISGDGTRSVTVWTMLSQFFGLNIALAVFNLIPIPPLDGSKVLMSVLPRDKAAKFEEIASKLSWVLLALIIFGGGRYLIYPVINVGMQVLYWGVALVS